MTALFEIPVINAPDQKLDTVLNDVPVTLRLFWNAWLGRWSLSVELNGAPVLEGRRIVTGTDLLASHELGLGRLYAVDWNKAGGQPGRETFPSGDFRMIQVANA